MVAAIDCLVEYQCQLHLTQGLEHVASRSKKKSKSSRSVLYDCTAHTQLTKYATDLNPDMVVFSAEIPVAAAVAVAAGGGGIGVDVGVVVLSLLPCFLKPARSRRMPGGSKLKALGSGRTVHRPTKTAAEERRRRKKGDLSRLLGARVADLFCCCCCCFLLYMCIL